MIVRKHLQINQISALNYSLGVHMPLNKPKQTMQRDTHSIYICIYKYREIYKNRFKFLCKSEFMIYTYVHMCTISQRTHAHNLLAYIV